MDIITPELATALDRTKVLDIKAIFVVPDTTKNLRYDINEGSLNRITICHE